MIRSIRRRLRLISYHSARRERTAWGRAVVWAMFLSPLLALPVALVSEFVVSRGEVTQRVEGSLRRMQRGELAALVWNERGLPEPGTDPDLLGWPGHGEWTIETVDVERGWPCLSLRTREPPRLGLKRYDDPVGVQRDAHLPEDSPERLAIQRALRLTGRGDLARAWSAEEQATPARSWLATIGSALVWWVLLTIISTTAIGILRLVTRVARASRREHKAARAARGRCPRCDYDLRGLEFSERCPECGEVLR